MALSLSVPVLAGGLPGGIETNAKKARAWIESLPLTRTIEAGTTVAQTIEALNRAKISADERVALVDIYRPVIAVILDELEAIYAYSVLPLPLKQREAFELARELSTQCAIAYKHVLLEKPGKLPVFGAKKNLPQATYSAMFYLQSQLLQSYKTYLPVPAGVWQELNSLYQYAEESGMLAEIGDVESKLSVQDLYIDTVMISLADPYCLMFNEVDRVQETLKQNRGLVQIHSSSEGLSLLRFFLVALDGDQPPKVLVDGVPPPPGQIFRLIDPTRLVEKLQQPYRAQPGVGSSSRANQDNPDLQQRLIRLWSDPPKRQFRRNAADTAVAVCSGIKAIAYFTELAANEDPAVEAKAIRDGDTIPLLKIPRDEASQAMGVEEWQVLNQSANGLRLHRESGGNVAVMVGEVIGVRFMGGRSWNVGVVRWRTSLDGSALELGVELISPAATSITIAATIGGTVRAMPALVLQNTTPGWDNDTVLSLADTFSDLREYELVENEVAMLVRATNLLERTSRFDLFQFQMSK